jgi:predicted PurR-regulated permease PerM
MHTSHEKAALFSGPAVQKWFLLALVLAITGLLLVMVRGFLVSLILAGVFAGLSQPALRALTRALGGRRRAASMLTVLGLLLLIVVPVGAFLALVVAQAAELSEIAGPWIQSQGGRWEQVGTWLRGLPFVGGFAPEQEELAARASDLVGTIGAFLLSNARAATTGTLGLVLQLFVTLYALYFFLMDGPAILSRILYYTPLDERDERKLISQFVSVTRATIKGSILVGLLQGALAGSAFFVLQLPAAAFWSTVMAVLSVIPVLGSGIVWAPAAVILAMTGRVGAAVGLAVWGVVVVGMVDNFLRPRLVGRDTKMHDLLVLLTTFGGLAMFGIVGFIIGPIIGALFLTALDLYGARFGELLPDAPSEAALAGEQLLAGPPAAAVAPGSADTGSAPTERDGGGERG